MQKNFDPSKPPKDYDPRKKYFNPRNPCNPRKNLTHATHTLTEPTLPQNLRDLADSIESKISTTLQYYFIFQGYPALSSNTMFIFTFHRTLDHIFVINDRSRN